ncbi:MAG: hypothetical protein WC907_08290 [Acholeplasmataceae bacterium]|jgi:hypothetical protein
MKDRIESIYNDLLKVVEILDEHCNVPFERDTVMVEVTYYGDWWYGRTYPTILQIGSIVFLGHSYSAETVDELLSEMAARVKEDIDCLKKGMCQAIQ